MNRIIRFRAWDKKEKRFWSQEEMKKIGGFYYNFGLDPDPEKFELVEFTGLKDRNNKEIYEGDILRIPTSNYDPSEGESPYELLEVIWNRSGWYSAQYELADYENAGIEIIGNIYSNPELLK